MQNAEWQAEIVAVEEAANTAFLNRDLARLDQLFSEELLVNSPINIVNTKPKLLELLGTGVIGHVSSSFKHELIRPPSRRSGGATPTSGARKAIAGGSTSATPA